MRALLDKINELISDALFHRSMTQWAMPDFERDEEKTQELLEMLYEFRRRLEAMI